MRLNVRSNFIRKKSPANPENWKKLESESDLTLEVWNSGWLNSRYNSKKGSKTLWLYTKMFSKIDIVIINP